MRMSRAVFRYVETELYDYDQTKRALRAERDDVILAGSPPAGRAGARNGSSDPTAAKASKLLSSTSILRMERTITAIDRALARLDQDYCQMFELYYRQELPWPEVCARLPMSQAAFFRRRRRLVVLVARYMGYDT